MLFEDYNKLSDKQKRCSWVLNVSDDNIVIVCGVKAYKLKILSEFDQRCSIHSYVSKVNKYESIYYRHILLYIV